VPGADDIMLNYQSSSFQDSHYLRQVLGLRPAPEFDAWLEGQGLMRGGRLESSGGRHALLDFNPLLAP
jgi:ethanolamine ammonia-lyase large subunit